MDKIIDFLERYFEEERKMLTFRRIPNLDRYNKQVRTVQDFLLPEMHEKMGDVEMRFKGPDAMYSMSDDDPLKDPRGLFKISKYKHPSYSDVWVAYTSLAQLNLTRAYLSVAMFIVRDEDDFKIASAASYSSYSSEGLHFQWEKIGGKEDLDFSKIEGPSEILRIRAPLEGLDSLKLYDQEI